MIKAIFFDLDGTLLPLDEEEFTKVYFKLLCKRLSALDYEPNELINVILEGTKAMYKNDGKNNNEFVFWKTFEKHYGSDKLKDKEYINEFYIKEFKEISKVCGKNPLAKKIVDYCNSKNLLTVLSTNPIFPKLGTLTRMSFINLTENDFDYITSYENSNFSKPNPEYFKSLLSKFNLQPNEVLLFGNNTYEDGECALACGIKCFMVENNIINHPKSTHIFSTIKIDEIIPTIDKFIRK